MKLSFTTLACPGWDISKIVDAAVASRYDAIDFRGYLDAVEIVESRSFKGRALSEIASRVMDAGLEVSCLSSGARMTARDKADRECELDKMRRYAELCGAFGCRQVRIFGGAVEGVADPVASAAETLATASEIARDAGIVLAVETHDDWSNTTMLRSALRSAGDPDGIGLLWDLQHPWFAAGEKPDVSARNLAGKLCNTHWKDMRRMPDGGFHLCLVGKGELPLHAVFTSLRSIGYEGWATLEWEKRWHPDIEEPEIAIPAFAEFFRELARKPATM